MLWWVLGCAGEIAVEQQQEMLPGACPFDESVGYLTVAELDSGDQMLTGGLTDKPSRFYQVIGEAPCQQWVERVLEDERCAEGEYNPTGLYCETLPLYRTDYLFRVVADGEAALLGPETPVDDFYYSDVSEFIIELQMPEGTFTSPPMAWPDPGEFQALDQGSLDERGTLNISWSGLEGGFVSTMSSVYSIADQYGVTTCLSESELGGWELSPELAQGFTNGIPMAYGEIHHVYIESGCLELGVSRQSYAAISYAE